MKRIILLLVLALLPVYAAGAETPEKPALHVLIIPKFEIGAMSGDFPGEAQLLYERFLPGCAETEIPHMPPDAHFYMNPENGVGMLVTGSGKTAVSLSMMAVLMSDVFDYSGMYVVSVGCAGGSVAMCTLGDVVVVTAAVDYDLGHHVDTHERRKSNSRLMWFPDDSFADYEFKFLNADLCKKVYGLIQDCPLRTTEEAVRVMGENFQALDPEEILPSVKKGSALSGDNYWKGIFGHVTANYIADYYGCPDPYAVTEMEEIVVANTSNLFGLLDRLVSLRVVVNTDLFINGETPESTWGEHRSFSEKVATDNAETLDIFEPAMHNLSDTAGIVIDAILSGRIETIPTGNPDGGEDRAFRFRHDPRVNPDAMRDIVVNPAAVYGFSPKPADDSSLKQYADFIDWSDPEQVAELRKARLKYHESMEELYRIVLEMTNQDLDAETIARTVSRRRNELRLEAYTDSPESLAAVKAQNLETYGNENGPTADSLYEEFGSWESVLNHALGNNAGMDACVGLYDDYYYLYEPEPEEKTRK